MPRTRGRSPRSPNLRIEGLALPSSRSLPSSPARPGRRRSWIRELTQPALSQMRLPQEPDVRAKSDSAMRALTRSGRRKAIAQPKCMLVSVI